MPKNRLFLLFICILSAAFVNAQKKSATVSGKVLDENENPLGRVNISILGRNTGLSTSDSGTFSIKVPANKAFALVFSYTGYKTEQRNFLLNEGEEEKLSLRLQRGTTELENVTVTDQRQRKEAGLI